MSTAQEYEPNLPEGAEKSLVLELTGQDATLVDLQKELGDLREDSDSAVLERMYQSLATSVGKQQEFQTPFRETGILALALKGLESNSAPKSLRKQYLRLVGNCVADNDLNREVVTKDLQKLVALITDEELSTIALIVLFNLCNDFDPAKAAAASLRLDATISRELFLQNVPEPALDYAVDILTWTTGKLTADQLKDEYSLETFAGLLKVALQYDEDHYHEYVAILVHYIQDPEFQQSVATPKFVDDLVVLMLDFEARIPADDIEAVFQELALTKPDEAQQSEETSVLLLSQLINSISALSATDAFAQNFNVRSAVIERIRAKLKYPTSKSPSAVCACVMLGNLAMSDEVCIDMVSIMQLHLPLRDMLFFDKHSALLYAALGVLRHLAFPEQNRTELGDARVVEACHAYLVKEADDPAVRGEVAALLCKLVTNNPKNIERVVFDRVGESKDEQGELPLESVSNGPTCFEDLVEQSLMPGKPLPSTSMKNMMVEAGRTIVAILRYLGRAVTGGDLDVDAVRLRMFECPDVARPLAKLVRQRFYADARSEGLLGLGLMAQSPEGASRVIDEIKDDAGLLEAIKEFAEGKDGGAEQQGQAAGRDYQNAVVLLQALQNHWPNEGDGTLKDQIASLQNSLGKMMV
ncbi:hypothetical protein HBH64_051930 [Parastagonospora nodorum]|nr:hypothetical protein HBH53_130850 [Parastagonospora nodorum]KAH4302686.1 hypothetical protein HBI01_091170 [Parastagonospora nodorum]KAH4312038.1 hypothetical protein HBI02_088040 [Parastagonospora nodorum]KAH4331251.1 hypothetical protein HBI00_073270 [Parastagonospora nodorum]KAH4371682.1 hypothetical protein HBH94_116940 [Parastagonospora nodorum]